MDQSRGYGDLYGAAWQANIDPDEIINMLQLLAEARKSSKDG
jgi:hypothetical protein